jgi:3-hydroxyacyl-[acyl-carrier-protein] dehydratase
MTENLLSAPITGSEVEKYLPHRYPFLLVDKAISLTIEPERKIVCVKNVTINEHFFQGHFPGNPVMPGVLMIEAMAQAAGMMANLIAEIEEREAHLFYLVKVDKARFNKLVIPGDQLILEAVQKRLMRGMGLYEARGLVDGKQVASCELLCAGR